MIKTTSLVFGTKTIPHFVIFHAKELRDQVKRSGRDLNRVFCCNPGPLEFRRRTRAFERSRTMIQAS